MDLFSIGPLELLLILGVSFLVFGPEGLQDMARTIGGFMKEFRRARAVFSESLVRDITDSNTTGSPYEESAKPPIPQAWSPVFQPRRNPPETRVEDTEESPTHDETTNK